MARADGVAASRSDKRRHGDASDSEPETVASKRPKAGVRKSQAMMKAKAKAQAKAKAKAMAVVINPGKNTAKSITVAGAVAAEKIAGVRRSSRQRRKPHQDRETNGQYSSDEPQAGSLDSSESSGEDWVDDVGEEEGEGGEGEGGEGEEGSQDENAIVVCF